MAIISSAHAAEAEMEACRRSRLLRDSETAAVCEHLHYPLQSGSDAVLAAMHRGYTAQRYLDRLAEARRLIPDLAVTTDVIVGFPGETEADFDETLAVVAEADHILDLGPGAGAHGGQIIAQGTPALVQADPEVNRAYLGSGDVGELRRKLQDGEDNPLIETVRGVGYRARAIRPGT